MDDRRYLTSRGIWQVRLFLRQLIGRYAVREWMRTKWDLKSLDEPTIPFSAAQAGYGTVSIGWGALVGWTRTFIADYDLDVSNTFECGLDAFCEGLSGRTGVSL